jgi:hypothetical protein
MNWLNGLLCDHRAKAARDARVTDLLAGMPKHLPDMVAEKVRTTRRRAHDLDDRRFIAERAGDGYLK